MATRRIINSEKTFLDQDDDNTMQEKSNITPVVPKDVIYKLLAFTFAMVVIPISSYFLTVHTVFAGNSSYAAGLAALLANVVLIGYIVVAMNEDAGSDKDGKSESRKDK